MSDGAEAALPAAAWRAMRALVLDHDRRREAGRAVGLSFVRVKALLSLDDGPRSMSDLAGALAVDSPYATVVVKDLVGRGLVERRIRPDDRRGRLVALTPAGARSASRARAILEAPPPALAGLDRRRLEQLVDALSAVTGRSGAPGRTTPAAVRPSPGRPAAPHARAGQPRSG
ncbi:MAG: MarR family winged helix-turn-helix transcriptional regulator [Acidimicrobiales bacterium]